jgi:hypothetical protein
MAWTQADIDALERSIAEGLGAGSMTFSDQSVTFASLADRLALLATMRAAVNDAAGVSKKTRYAAFSKGV